MNGAGTVIPPASAGWDWIKRGFALFRKQPAELSTLFFAYLFLVLVLSMLPLLGTLVAVLMPALSMAFMQAAVQVERGERVYPMLLTYGLRSPALKRLLLLGVVNIATWTLALAISTLFDEGALWRLLMNQDEVTPQATRAALGGMLAAAAVYVPVMMASWYAAPLITWQDMAVPKALFFSFFAVKRATKAFLVYGAIWALAFTLVPGVLNGLLLMLTGSATVAVMVTMPLVVVGVVVMLCSFYPMYADIFGRPGGPGAGQPPAP